MPIFVHPFRTPKTLWAFTRSLSQVAGFFYIFAPFLVLWIGTYRSLARWAVST